MSLYRDKVNKKISHVHYRPIENPVKHLRWNVLQNLLAAFSRLLFQLKRTILDVLQSSEYTPL